MAERPVAPAPNSSRTMGAKMKSPKSRGLFKKNENSERGMATLETLPLIFIFLYLFAYTLGSFGTIHTGIKYSIAARAYAFETFRNRTDLTYFRDRLGAPRNHYRANGNRFHAIIAPGSGANDQFRASRRAIRVGVPIEAGASENNVEIHNERVHQSEELVQGRRNRQVEVSPAWIMTTYGICLNNNCGG